jgi:hypothetical protein
MAGPRRVALWRAGLQAQASDFRMAPCRVETSLVTKAQVGVRMRRGMSGSTPEKWDSRNVGLRPGHHSGPRIEYSPGQLSFRLATSLSASITLVLHATKSSRPSSVLRWILYGACESRSITQSGSHTGWGAFCDTEHTPTPRRRCV